MKKEAIKHIPKSHMAYAFDDDTLHLYLQVAKDDIKNVDLIIEDPFNYLVDDNENYTWAGKLNKYKPMKKVYTTELFDYFFISVTSESKRSKYAFIIDDSCDKYFYGCRKLIKLGTSQDQDILYNLFGYFNYPYINHEDLIDSPLWSKNMVWYQIFPERFNKSKDTKGNYLEWGSITEGIKNHQFFGGNLRGIIEKLDYLNDLGINGIYFTPIFKAPSAHKYDTEDYMQIDPSFGTNDDFKELVKECHKRNIKVMLDAVFNHCGWNHFMWQDVVQNKEKSKYYDCFFINGDPINFELDENKMPVRKAMNSNLNYRTFAKTPFMPKWNTDNEIVNEYLLNVGEYWVKEYDIDGWRLDVSNEVSHKFWREFKRRLRAIKPDLYILGENWDDSTPWLRGDQFDAVMNYEIAYPVWQFICSDKSEGAIDAQEFMHRINNLLIQYPKNISAQMFNLVDSHDTPRILHRCSNQPDLLKLCYLFIFSFVGSPAIYYGDEIGLYGKKDPDCRRCMIWDEDKQNKDLYNFFKKMIHLKLSETDFSLVDITWHYANDGVIIYQKGKTFFLLNTNNKNVKIVLPEALKNKTLYNIFDNANNILSEELQINKFQFMILK